MTNPGTLRVGIDLVQVSRVAESLERFGDRFLRRVFTESEIAYASADPAQTAERLAARFAAKEATLKALDLADRMAWRDVEVRRAASGGCELALTGGAARAARAAAGTIELAVSLSHEGDYAAAFVVARLR